MNRGRIRICSLALATVIGSAACSAGAAATPGGIATPGGGATSAGTPSGSPIAFTDAPVTLRLAVADDAGKPSESAVNHFVGRVAALSGGNVTIVPTFNAGAGTEKGFEEGVADLVERGDTELGLAASRAWDLVGVASLQALQAPYLIDSDALAVAVARSDVARRALDGMAGGVVGLTLWPEDLRHLFSFPKCGKDFRSVSGLAGSTVLIPSSAVTRELLQALGGIEYAGTERVADAEACTLHGQEAGFSQLAAIADHTAVATGNVTLYPKYQVLAANKAAFDHLGASQRQVLRDAALDTQIDAITSRKTDAELAIAWCAQGGSVVVANAEQRAKFLAAAGAIDARLEADLLTMELIVDIRTLKASTPATDGPMPCERTANAPAPSSATADLTGYVGTMFPNGTFRAELKRSDLIAQGATPAWATTMEGTWTTTYKDGEYTAIDGGGTVCHGTYQSINGEFVRVTSDPGGPSACEKTEDNLWKLAGDGIRIAAIHMDGIPAQDYLDIARYLDRVWIKIE